MDVHYIWIGGNKVPDDYFNNLNQCVSLNPTHNFIVWDDTKGLELLYQYNLTEYWNNLPTLISKCCMLRYLILDTHGGIYTDFDILWHKPFDDILSRFYTGADLLLTYNNFSSMIVDNKQVHVLDDPFIFSKPGVLLPCIEYCQTRTELINDGELYMNTGELKTHKLEPVGPFGLTEWLYKFKIKFDCFPQVGYIDQFRGKFGYHDQKTNWNK
jgi:hypothetical protein